MAEYRPFSLTSTAPERRDATTEGGPTMTGTGQPGRRRPMPFRTAAATVWTVGALALALTACDGDDGATATPAPTVSATAHPSGGGDAAAAGATPGGTATAGKGGGTAGAPGTATPAAAASPTPKPSPSGPDPAAGAGDADTDCDHKMPISPDEIAVLRHTPEGGSLSLVFKHGNWGCPTPDSDGPPFVTTGKETFLPLDQAAHITVTDPIVASTENQHIGVQEFLDWLEAHPNSGLVFTYHVGADGAIDTLEQVFTP
ncbi:hypothetical protein ACIF8T_25360 [Streptomyces sp. NPDC085946]|uniref:hypothetical protein n=1 Tax=Streptomyces sp. NPDC085946 TaxID=3365744 RepID=UPI0037CF33E9